MNTIALATIYRDKNRSQFKSNPTHGTPGWIEDDGEFKELIYWDKDGKAEWVIGDEYKKRKRAIKEGKIAYYRQHPGELIKKLYQREGYKLGVVFSIHTAIISVSLGSPLATQVEWLSFI